MDSLYLPQTIREQIAMNRIGVVDTDKSTNTNNIRSGPNTTNTNDTSAYK